MSFTISHVHVTLVNSPGKKKNYWDSACCYQLEENGNVFQVARLLFKERREGHDGLNSHYLATENGPQSIENYKMQARCWEAHDRGQPRPAGYKLVISHKMIRSAPLQQPTPPVQTALQSVQAQLKVEKQNNVQLQQDLKATNAKVGNLTNVCADLRREIEAKNQVIAQLRADFNANQVQIQNLSREVEALTRSLNQLIAALV
jgi:hypothetical protein